MAGREGARGALAMHAYELSVVVLQFCDVVGDVVDLTGGAGRLGSEHSRDCLAGVVGDRGPVGPGEVGGRGHRALVLPSLG